MENMIKMLIKALGLKPDQVQDQINGASKMLVDFQSQLNRIEIKLDSLSNEPLKKLLGE